MSLDDVSIIIKSKIDPYSMFLVHQTELAMKMEESKVSNMYSNGCERQEGLHMQFIHPKLATWIVTKISDGLMHKATGKRNNHQSESQEKLTHIDWSKSKGILNYIIVISHPKSFKEIRGWDTLKLSSSTWNLAIERGIWTSQLWMRTSDALQFNCLLEDKY